ncbi:MAG: aminotransferase class I/II-fold pyridoxal phosphate-dependent enzyme, partial [Limnobacter sp.]
MELVKAADALQAQGNQVIHLSIGEPDFPLPKPIEQALARAISEHKTRYTSALGLPELREAISQYYQSNFQVQVPAHQIVITSGASAALMYACLALVNPADKVLVADPGSPCNQTCVHMAGGCPDCVETDEEERFQPSCGGVVGEW